jgi:hypothetical protein
MLEMAEGGLTARQRTIWELHPLLALNWPREDRPMPNGRTGGFDIKKSALEELLLPLEDPTAVVGTRPFPKTADVSVADVRQLIEQFPDVEVSIEEHGSWYVMKLDHRGDSHEEPVGEKWIMVGESSPLSGPLRHSHQSWLRRRGELNED